jgi:hypothetical protein
MRVEVPMPVNTKNSVFWDMTPHSGYKCADVSEEPTASVFRVEDKSSRFLRNVSTCYQTTWYPSLEDGTVPFFSTFGHLYIIIIFRIDIL